MYLLSHCIQSNPKNFSCIFSKKKLKLFLSYFKNAKWISYLVYDYQLGFGQISKILQQLFCLIYILSIRI